MYPNSLQIFDFCSIHGNKNDYSIHLSFFNVHQPIKEQTCNFRDFHSNRRIPANIPLVTNITDYSTSGRGEYFKQMKIFIKHFFCSEKRTQKYYFLTN
jgi:hypothetical protein